MSITAFNHHELISNELPPGMESVQSPLGPKYIYADRSRSPVIDVQAAGLLQRLLRKYDDLDEALRSLDGSTQVAEEVPEHLHEKSNLQIAVWLGATAARFGADVALIDMNNAEEQASQLLAETGMGTGKGVADMGLLIVVEDNGPVNEAEAEYRDKLKRMVAVLDMPVLSVGGGYVSLVEQPAFGRESVPEPSRDLQSVVLT